LVFVGWIERMRGDVAGRIRIGIRIRIRIVCVCR
jgi:hypothetical protein